MKRFIAALLVTVSLYACSTNAFTGRSQLTLYSETEIQTMATQEYRQFLTENKVVAASVSKDAEMVKRVGSRIATAITNFYTQKGLGKELEGYKWEYNLVASNQVNAWCMPGGKIVVYSGLLPVTQNEAALAVVLGHEITHAVAKHGSERMSEGLIQQLGGAALSVALSSKPAETRNLFLQAYDAGSTIGVSLPHSRNQEYEADHYGLIYAALAGYNPREAIPLWERMAAMSSGQKPPEFLSDHPAEGNRIQRLQELMPEALKYYRPIGSK